MSLFSLEIVVNYLLLSGPFLVKTDSPASLDMVCSPSPQGRSALHKDLGTQKTPKPSALCHRQQKVLGEALTQAYR